MGFLERLFTRSENFAKGVLFDCRHCGQCVLSHTGYTQCPMACPRQARNGPCGGSMDEHCEVYPERACVWARIHQLVDKNGTSTPPLLPSPDPKLFFTSSYLNYLTGKDLRARTPIEYLDLGVNRKQQAPQTASQLEAKLRAGTFVFTSEIRSPRGAEPDKVEKHAMLLRDHFDALNATAYLNGRPSMPSAIASAQIARCGVEPICQSVCRDLTKTAFISELITNKMNGVHNSLCITGDYYLGEPGVKQVYDMDSSLMIYEARYLREKGVIFFTGDTMKEPPKPFIGGAINPFTTPWNVPIRRLKQKAAAGVDFIQTQVVLDLGAFKEFMRVVHDEGIDNDVFILAGLPVIISKKAFEMLPGVPGIRVPKAIMERFADTKDIVQEGIALARELITEVRTVPGVSGVHLMLFGLDHKVLPAVVEGLRGSPAGLTVAA